MNKVLEKIRKELKENVDLKYKKGVINFFNEPIENYGVRTPIVRKISRSYFKFIKDKDKNQIFAICEKLLKTNLFEEAIIAFDWSFRIKEKFEKSDYTIYERWISKYVNNWAKCDDFCTHSFGYFIYKFPEFIVNLKKYTKSKNRWVRRVSAVSLIYSIRKKKYLDDVFEIADLLLTDKDDLVQKGYGWLLKVTADYHQKQVFDFVYSQKTKMPRTALRYAIEKMPKELKKKIMK